MIFSIFLILAITIVRSVSKEAERLGSTILRNISEEGIVLLHQQQQEQEDYDKKQQQDGRTNKSHDHFYLTDASLSFKLQVTSHSILE